MSSGASLTKSSSRFGTIFNTRCSVSALRTISRDRTSGDDHERSTYMAILGSRYLGGGRPHQDLLHTDHNNAKRNIERVSDEMTDGPVHTQTFNTTFSHNDSCDTTNVGKLLMDENAAQMIGQQLPPEFRQHNYTLMNPPLYGGPREGTGHVRIVQNRPKPRCWEHGCNGRQFSTFSNLLRHQREKSGQKAAQMTGQQLPPEFRQYNYILMNPQLYGGPRKETGHVRIVQNRPKPQCWEHGCNGRQFSTFSNLLRHQREKSGQTTKVSCPNCGAEFTRTTARNGYLLHAKCRSRREF